MKAIITLKESEETLEFLENIDLDELKSCVDFVYIANMDITLRGEFQVSYTGLSLWIEDKDYLLLRVPMNLVKDFIVKENK